MTGSSEKQDMQAVLGFAKTLLPNLKRVGLLYGTGESNDLALVKMMQKAAQDLNLEVVAVPVSQARDVPIAMQQFKGKADLIYVGSSGPIQPTLPVIAAESRKMQIPVINVDADAAEKGMVLASYGVNYTQVGVNAAALAAKILKGQKPSDLAPIYPKLEDHHGCVNLKQAQAFGINVPTGLKNIRILGEG